MKNINCFKIDQDTKSKILKLFDKNFNDLEQDVELIKDWLKTQPHLPEAPSDAMIEYFLVNNKFSLENSKKKIDAYYTVRCSLFEQIGDTNPKLEKIKAGYNSISVVPLPKLKDSLYRIVLIKVKDFPVENFEVEAYMANILNLYEIRMHEDLMCGDILIFDDEHLKLGHITKVKPLMFKLFATYLEKVYSNRLKELHAINYPPALEVLIKLCKLFVKPKIMDRIHLHDSLDSLNEYVSLELLPKEYGGKQPSLDELEDSVNQKLEEYRPRFDKLDTMRVQESLRPKSQESNDDFGVEGSFRKLTVD